MFFDDVPWLRPFLSWSVALALAWVVMAGPSYVLAALLTRATIALRAELVLYRRLCRYRRDQQLRALSELKKEVVSAFRPEKIDAVVYGAWRQPLDQFNQAVTLILEKHSANEQRFDSALRDVRTTIEQLARVEQGLPQHHGLYTADEVATHALRYKRSVVDALLLSFFLVAVLAVNAILSSVVLRELLPPVQTSFENFLPLSFVVALMLAMAEAVVGVLHAKAGIRDAEDRRQIIIPQLILSIFALAVVGFETFLYSLFASEAEGSPSVFGISVPLGSGFALIGFILGGMLFFLASAAYRSLVDVMRYGGAKAIGHQLRRLTESGREWQRVLDDISSSQEALRETFQELLAKHRTFADWAILGVRESIEYIERVQHSPPDWAVSRTRFANDAEINNLVVETHLYACVGAAAAIATVATFVFALGLALPEVSGWWQGATAIGATLIALLAGYSWGAQERDEEIAYGGFVPRSARKQIPWIAGMAIVLLLWIAWVSASFDSQLDRVMLWLAVLPAFVVTLAAKKSAGVPGYLRPVLVNWWEASLWGLGRLLLLPAILAIWTVEVLRAVFSLIGHPVAELLKLVRRRQSAAPRVQPVA